MDNCIASLTLVCFVPDKGLTRDLSANSKWWWQSGLISHKDSQLWMAHYAIRKKVNRRISFQKLVFLFSVHSSVRYIMSKLLPSHLASRLQVSAIILTSEQKKHILCSWTVRIRFHLQLPAAPTTRHTTLERQLYIIQLPILWMMPCVRCANVLLGELPAVHITFATWDWE